MTKKKTDLYMVSLLTPLGFNVIEAIDGQEGINKAQEILPDLILTDLVMPVMDGFEATRQIRKNPSLQNTPIIAASANVFDSRQGEIINSDFNGSISKPFKIDDLLEELRKCLNLTWIY